MSDEPDAPAHTTLPIDIVSDFVCPWCYVGVKRLATALETAGPVALRYRPFFLNPWVPRDGMARADFLTAKFGSADAAALYGRVSAAGAGEGIVFNLAAIRVQPQTVDAHRLMALARRFGAEHRLAAALFAGFFEKGLDIGDPRVLAALAAEAGIEADIATAFLTGTEETGRVIREAQQAVEECVEGVPLFVIGSVLAVSGAQPAPVLAQAIAEARRRRELLRPA